MSDRDPRIAKLPQWAQREIERLEANVNYWKAQVASAVEGESNVRINRGWREDAIYLPKDCEIEFITGTRVYGGDYVAEAGFSVRVRERSGLKREGDRPRVTGLEVQGRSPQGQSPLAVYPQSSNMVWLETEAP